MVSAQRVLCWMGCGASLGKETVTEGYGLASLIKDAHIHPRETRILQIPSFQKLYEEVLKNVKQNGVTENYCDTFEIPNRLHEYEALQNIIEEVDTYEDCENVGDDNNEVDQFSTETALANCCHVTEVTGAWIWGISAGGSRNNLEMFQVNPQYLLQVGHEEIYLRKMFSATRRTASVVETHVSLAQLDAKRLLHIAFFIYKTALPAERQEAEYFLCVTPDECSGTFKNLPVVRGRYLLKSGAYILIPATFQPYHCARFQIKVHATRSVSLSLI